MASDYPRVGGPTLRERNAWRARLRKELLADPDTRADAQKLIDARRTGDRQKLLEVLGSAPKWTQKW